MSCGAISDAHLRPGVEIPEVRLRPKHLGVSVAALLPCAVHVDKSSVFAEPAVGLRGDTHAYQRGGVLRADLEAASGEQNVRVRGQAARRPSGSGRTAGAFPPVGLRLCESTRTLVSIGERDRTSVTSGCGPSSTHSLHSLLRLYRFPVEKA